MIQNTDERKKLKCSFCENDLNICETYENDLFILECLECERTSLISKKKLLNLGVVL